MIVLLGISSMVPSQTFPSSISVWLWPSTNMSMPLTWLQMASEVIVELLSTPM